MLLLTLLTVACSRQESGEQPPSAEGAQNPSLSLQERRLLTAATIALPPEGLAPESLPDPTSRGAQLLASYCTQCHALPSPASHGAMDWPGVLRRMWVRIDMMQGELGVRIPQAGERTQLLEYLIANAIQVPRVLPAGAGRAEFEALCSRCHTLPDPRIHSPPDWPAVVLRMERNMERMRVRGLTPAEAQQIVTYLQAASRR
jgi:mono/diheme cytochrome c family protein